jgi:hypothetical protein
MAPIQLQDNKLGLMSGNGTLPVKVAQKATKEGYQVYAVCFDRSDIRTIEEHSISTVHYSPGEVEKILIYLKKNDIKQVMFIGKVPKLVFFQIHKFDKRAMNFIKKANKLNDNAIMLAAIKELESEGIKVLDQTIFIKDFFAHKGHIAGPELNECYQSDIEYGFEAAKNIGKMDIGQTVVVQDKMILAVEAIEGTDEAIKRGCKLGKGRATIVKVSKPDQDQRFDIPVIGEKTISMMYKYGGKVLAIEAYETLIVNEDKVKTLANKYGITVIAV